VRAMAGDLKLMVGADIPHALRDVEQMAASQARERKKNIGASSQYVPTFASLEAVGNEGRQASSMFVQDEYLFGN